MNDQAARLREIMGDKEKNEPKSCIERKAKTTTIISGKGGVGKTNFAINLAISIRRLGYKVAIIDADLGLANVEILTGIDIKHRMVDLIVDGKDIDDIIYDGPEGIKLISGGMGLEDLSIMNEKNIERMISAIEGLEYIMDYIIIDTGAGMSNMVIDFVLAANEVILVTTPEPTSVMDAYTMIKALTSCGYRGKLNIVVNIVNNRKEAIDIFERLNRASNNFLETEINFLGYLERDSVISRAVIDQKPFVITSPRSIPSKRINIMALKYIDKGSIINKKGLGFAKKLKSLFLRKGVN